MNRHYTHDGNKLWVLQGNIPLFFKHVPCSGTINRLILYLSTCIVVDCFVIIGVISLFVVLFSKKSLS